MVTIIFEEWDNKKIPCDFKKPEFAPEGTVELRITWKNPCRYEVAEYDDKMRMNRKEDGRDYYIYQYQDPSGEIYGDDQTIRFEDIAECIEYSEFEMGSVLDALLGMLEKIIWAYRNEEEKELRSEIDMAEDFIVNNFGEEE